MRIFLFVSLFVFTQVAVAQDITNNTFGKGIKIIAKDSSFSIKFGARFQTLYEGTYTEDTDDWEEQLSIRRWRLKFDGFAYSPKLEYKLEIGLSNRDIGDERPRIILDAVLKYHLNSNWQVWMGQTKLPGNRERVISSQKLQFVDRSMLNSRFNLDRDVGVQVHHENKIGKGILRQMGSISMGDGRNPTSPNIGGHDYTGRVEYLPFGEFTSDGDYFSSDLKRESKPKLAFGFTYDFNKGASKSRGQLGSEVINQGIIVENDLRSVYADAIFKYSGWSLLTEYAERAGEDNIAGFGTGTGFNIQSGYLFKNNFEIALRYSSIKADEFSSLATEKEYTIGLSRYIVGHSLKVQSDISYGDKSLSSNTLRYRFQIEMAF